MNDFVSIPRSELQRLIDSMDRQAKQNEEAHLYTGDRLNVGICIIARNTHSILVDMMDKADKGGHNANSHT